MYMIGWLSGLTLWKLTDACFLGNLECFIWSPFIWSSVSIFQLVSSLLLLLWLFYYYYILDITVKHWVSGYVLFILQVFKELINWHISLLLLRLVWGFTRIFSKLLPLVRNSAIFPATLWSPESTFSSQHSVSCLYSLGCLFVCLWTI